MNKVFYAHKAAVFANIKRLFIAVLLPSILNFLTGRLLLGGIMIAAVIFFSILKQRREKIVLKGAIIVLYGGFLVEKRIILDKTNLTEICAKESIYGKMFDFLKLSVYSTASKKPIYKTHLSKKDFLSLCNMLFGNVEPSRTQSDKNILLWAAVGSSLISGLLFAVPMLNFISKIMGNRIYYLIYDRIASAADRLTFISRPAFVLSCTAAILYFISFLKIFLSRIGFKYGKKGSSVCIKCGILPSNSKYADFDNTVSIRERFSPLGRVLGVGTISFCQKGGKKSAATAVFKKVHNAPYGLIKKQESFVRVEYRRWLALNTAVIKNDCISGVAAKTNIFNRIRKTASVLIYAKGDKHKIKLLSEEKAKEIIYKI